MNKELLLMGAVIAVGIIIGMSLTSAGKGTLTGNIAQGGEYQKATLRVENYGYVVEPNVLQAGVPVRMEVDLNTVKGCARSVNIPEFKVNQLVSPGKSEITFTPTKEGTIAIRCSMNMYRGTFVVGKASGTVLGA